MAAKNNARIAQTEYSGITGVDVGVGVGVSVLPITATSISVPLYTGQYGSSELVKVNESWM